MKILLVSSIYPPTIGGPAPHTQQIAREWARLGYSVEVCVPSQEEPIAPEQGFTLTVMTAIARQSLLGKVQRWFHYAIALSRSIRRRRPDFCVMMVFGGPLAFVTGIMCRLHGIPAIVKLTGERAFESAMERRSRDNEADIKDIRHAQLAPAAVHKPGLQDVVLTRLFKAVWATSPAFSERLERVYRLPRHRIFCLSNFIDLSRFETTRRNRMEKAAGSWSLLTVCRLRPWKGIETCLRAASQLRDVPFHWEFIGSGADSYVASLRQLARTLRIEDRVSFRGAVPPDHIQEHYQKADLFVLLSDYEPFGIVLVEAMSAGVPIVASRTGGIPYVTERDACARLVEPRSPRSAAEAIQALLLNPEERLALVQRGLNRANDFSITSGCRRLAEYGRSFAPSTKQGPETTTAETARLSV